MWATLDVTPANHTSSCVEHVFRPTCCISARTPLTPHTVAVRIGTTENDGPVVGPAALVKLNLCRRRVLKSFAEVKSL